MRRRSLPLSVLATGVLATGLLVAGLTTAPAQAAPRKTSAATDGPGAASYQDQSRKDCVGTARNRTSKIWFTVADGVLSDVYAPTVDATNLSTLQYVVTDGSSFTDLQQRDTSYRVVADPTGMLCTVVSTANSGAYRLTTSYLADPARDAVVIHTRYVPLTKAARSYRLYARMDAMAGGNGGGAAPNGGGDTAVIDRSTGSPVPVTYDTNTTSQSPRAYAVPSYLALGADRPFTTASSGFVGAASDGLTELDDSHALTPAYDTATDGNVEQTVALPLRHGDVTLGLGFGTTQAAAVRTASATAHDDLVRTVAAYESGWFGYDRGLRRPSRLPGLDRRQTAGALLAYYRSANVVKASEDKTFPGAIVAGLDAPWGQDVAANDPANLFSNGYREIFARDLYEAFTGLLTDGDIATARAATRFLLLRAQQPDGSLPRNSVLDGTKAADSFNIQLDESSYPILMVLQSGLADDDTLWPHVRAAADFLISHGPSYGVERWEEQTGYSPSTISAEIAGLVAAGVIARRHHAWADARTFLATADQYQRSIKSWDVTTTGSLSKRPYFIRLSKTGDPNAAISYGLGNGGPTLDQRDVVDLGFLEYARLGELPATDPTIANSLRVVDRTIQRRTRSGAGWLRYNGDGYGDCDVSRHVSSCATTGAPWAATFTGTGHPWPVLGVEHAQQSLALGDTAAAAAQLVTVNHENSGPGLVPEQVWDGADLARSPYGSDPATASIGFVNGQADGSASPLTWASAAQVRLTADVAAGRSVEQPAVTRNRYVTHRARVTPLSVTAPGDQTAVGGYAIVTGTAEPGAKVDVTAVDTDHDNATTHAMAYGHRGGVFRVRVPVGAGSNVLVISSTAHNGGTRQTTRTVVNDSVDGTLLYEATDPTGDDDGPGNYAYPTASDFHAGAFDLTDFRVYDTGSTVTFRVQTRDLTPTFGSTNGAQLVDLYVHDPAVPATSTAPSYPGMNYAVAPWNRLIEVQGFAAGRFVGPDGSSLGAVTTSANSVSRYITFSVDKSALGGTPGSGWGYAVALTGQDGTHGTDQTRAFTATPGGYTFGVCADGGTGASCTADPNTVPKVMDTITPAGTSQSGELDYTAHDPVTLTGVTEP